jgi:hypothetical protein
MRTWPVPQPDPNATPQAPLTPTPEPGAPMYVFSGFLELCGRFGQDRMLGGFNGFIDRYF